MSALAQLLHYSAGLIRRSFLRSAGEVHYRAAASAGALYPIELYVVCGDLPGLDAGIYHYSPADNALTPLCSGDFRGNLSDSAAGHDGIASAPATIVCTCVFWRSAWKYRERGYRYCYWDNGTILANLTATANALGLPAEVVAGFVDAEVDALLGLESGSEASFFLVPVGKGDATPSASASVPAIDPGVLGVERRTEYPETRALHANSCLGDAAEVRDWRKAAPTQTAQNAADWPESAPLGETVAHRGSTRRFARDPMPAGRLEALLSASTAPIPTDYGGGLIDTYLIVNAAEGIAPGSYYYSPGRGALELLNEGEFREEAGHLCFEQALGADASAVAFFMADLDSILSRLGNRGYRAPSLRPESSADACTWQSRNGPWRNRHDLLRRCRNRLLLAPCGRQEPDVPGRAGSDPRAQPGASLPLPHRYAEGLTGPRRRSAGQIRPRLALRLKERLQSSLSPWERVRVRASSCYTYILLSQDESGQP